MPDAGRHGGMVLDLGRIAGSVDSVNPAPTLRDTLGLWLKLGCLSFGGPGGHMAILHAELVERRQWIDEPRFLRALNFCLLLPGPEATQLATYCGWLLHGVRGGLVAGTLFVLPAAVVMWALSWLYVVHGTWWWTGALFAGLKPAVVAVVALAVWRVGRRALHGRLAWLLAGGAFVAMAVGRVPYPWVVATAALAGGLAGRAAPAGGEERAAAPGAAARSALRAALALLAAWWAPLLAVTAWQGRDGLLAGIGAFFSQTALVTVGGVYAVLPYVAHHAVEEHGWLTAAQMVDGLGLAEAKPGPLILVTQFVGFLAGWNQPAGLAPIGMATLGAVTATWATFLPSFVLVFLGAPHLERLVRHPRLGAALAGVSAATAGAVLALALWFATKVFLPAGGWAGGPDFVALGIFAAALAALGPGRAGTPAVLLGGAVLGLAVAAVGRAG